MCGRPSWLLVGFKRSLTFPDRIQIVRLSLWSPIGIMLDCDELLFNSIASITVVRYGELGHVPLLDS